MKGATLAEVFAAEDASPPAPTPTPRSLWSSTPNARRKHKATNLTLSPRGRAALEALAAAYHGGNLAEAASVALVARAEATGLLAAEGAEPT